MPIKSRIKFLKEIYQYRFGRSVPVFLPPAAGLFCPVYVYPDKDYYIFPGSAKKRCEGVLKKTVKARQKPAECSSA